MRVLIILLVFTISAVCGWLESCSGQPQVPVTPTPTITLTESPTWTATITASPTFTSTATSTPTIEPTLTETPTPTLPSASLTPTLTETLTETLTVTATVTETPINTTIPGRPQTIPVTGQAQDESKLLVLFLVGVILMLTGLEVTIESQKK